MAVLMDLEWVENGRQFSPIQLSAGRATDEWIETGRFYIRIRSTVEDDCTGAEMGLTGGLLPQFANAPTLMEVMNAFSKWLRPEDVLLWWNTKNAAVFARLWRYAFGKNMPSFGNMCDSVRSSWPKGIGNAPKSMLGLARETPLGALLPEHYALNDTENFRRILAFTGGSFSTYQAQGCMHKGTEFKNAMVRDAVKINWQGPVYITRGSRAQTIHLRGCLHLKNKTKSDLTMMPGIQAALSNGGHLCRHCLSVHHFYRNEQKEADTFAAEHHFTLSMDEDAIRIVSRKGQWRIALDEYTGGMALYHRNAPGMPGTSDPARFPGFHRQSLQPKTIRQCLEYIVDHDQYQVRKERRQAKQDRMIIVTHQRKGKQAGRIARKKREALREEAAWEEID